MSSKRDARQKNPKNKAAGAFPEVEPVGRVEVKRALLADFCRVWGDRVNGAKPPSVKTGAKSGDAPRSGPPVQGNPPSGQLDRPMSRRLRQTLDLLLAGEGEKQVALKLGISQHTVHDYVKGVYRLFGVNTRAELLALWVKKGEN
jgi:DNA-binding CsgD family transcriptional regulator